MRIESTSRNPTTISISPSIFDMAHTPRAISLLSLPNELLHHIVTYLPALTLVDLSTTCRRLRDETFTDALWKLRVNSNLPSHTPLISPHPFPSFRALYAAFHPTWFLPKNKIWIADNAATGKLILARYNPDRAVIEAHALVAEREAHTFSLWSHHNEVIIHNFYPKVQLDLHSPVLCLDPHTFTRGQDGDIASYSPHKPLQREASMSTHTGPGSYGICSTCMLSRPLDPALISPGTSVWPPLTIPANERTRNESVQQFNGSDHKPASLSELSTETFRIRKWMQFGSSRVLAYGLLSLRMGEDVVTYGTLKEEAYTPTLEKPWQGIWVGDYAGHGCEFLLMTQPEKTDERPLPEGVLNCGRLSSQMMENTAEDLDAESGTMLGNQAVEEVDAMIELSLEAIEQGAEQAENEQADQEEIEDSKQEESRGWNGEYHGRLEAIKLTGDPNIPRGEHTFVAPDIGPDGLIRVATEDPFRGARVVKSAGHIAGRGFRNGTLSPSFFDALETFSC